MPRNAQHPNDLHDGEREPRPSAADGDGAGAPPPFSFTPTGADPVLGWSGWGAESIAPWTARAEARVRYARRSGGDHPRPEPRQR
ncbi:MAG TPA: hypothetical protein VFJ16_10070 [Longimicrobium sp.]|nr:hypothetical protein [Longimicrobium sp.]